MTIKSWNVGKSMALQRDVGPADVCQMKIFWNEVKLIMNWQLRNVNQWNQWINQ